MTARSARQRKPHSVLTRSYRREGEETRAALDRVLGYFRAAEGLRRNARTPGGREV